jgi:diacylglycerol kinase family enzyme
MRIHAILNRNAGTVIGAGADVFQQKLTDTFKTAGHEITVEAVEPEQLVSSVKKAAGQGYDAIVVGGGDGTVNAAAGVLLGKKTALGILPLGTVNRLARDLDLSADVDAALRILAEAELRQIDVGEVNGHIFLNNSFIGLPPMVTERRASLRGRPLGERLRGYAALPMEVARGARRLALIIDDQETARVHRALTVVVSNNVYGEGASLIPKRPALDRGRLGLYISKHRNLRQTVFLLLRASLGLWKGDPDLEASEVKKLTISSNSGRLRVVNDGELLWLNTPLRYSIRPKALTILVPKQAAS